MTTFPYRLVRDAVIMTPDPDDPAEAEGVLNPAVAVGPEGRLVLFPRIVAAGNRSQIAVADVEIADERPVGVRRRGIALAPERIWERGPHHGGVEDPRVTWIQPIGRYVMTYVAFGPLGPRPAIAVSTDLHGWTRLGPMLFGYDDDLGVDLTLYANKDVAWFPEAVPGPDGEPCLAVLHRPSWEVPGGMAPPPGTTDERAAIWISWIPLAEVQRDLGALCRPRAHRELAHSEQTWESLKIGGGAPPIRVPEGWLLLYHGVTGTMSDNAYEPQKNVHYAAGGMIVDAADPLRVLARTSEPLLSPETETERLGTVGNVVFPTAIAPVGESRFCFYGMADAAIGTARIEPA